MVKILTGDALDVLKTLESQSVNCIVTSPPYYGLRDYGTAKWVGGDPDCKHIADERKTKKFGNAEFNENRPSREETKTDGYYFKDVCAICGAVKQDKQIGLEETPEAYIENLVAVFREARRVLRDDGVLWVNIGDSYWAGKGKNGSSKARATADERGYVQSSGTVQMSTRPQDGAHETIKPKDLIGIPWKLAEALKAPYYTGKIKNEHDRIWLAAMIDGEGCMFIHKRKAGQNNGQGYERKNDSYGAGLEVANCHESIVNRCLEITGLGSICYQDKESKLKNRNQRLFRWNLRSNECRNVVREVYPYLTAKKHEARLLLGCPSSGKEAEMAHNGLMCLHNGLDAGIDFKEPETMYEPGWWLRQDIIWSKLNPMPESVTDRCTKSHEYIFLLSKSKQYYYDAEAIKEPCVTNDLVLRDRETTKLNNVPGRTHMGGLVHNDYEMRNKRSVWEVSTQPFKEAHFATFPPALIVPCILAGCPQNGTVLDMFGGSGTTGIVASGNNRNAILIDLNPAYSEMQRARCGMFVQDEPSGTGF